MQNIWFKFLNVIDYLKNHQGAVEDAEPKILPAFAGQDHSERNILSVLRIYFKLFSQVVVQLGIAKQLSIRSRKLEYFTEKNQELQSR